MENIRNSRYEMAKFKKMELKKKYESFEITLLLRELTTKCCK